MDHLSNRETLGSPAPIIIQPITDIEESNVYAPDVMKSEDFFMSAPDKRIYDAPAPVGLMFDHKTAQNIVISDCFSIKPEHPHAAASTQFEG